MTITKLTASTGQARRAAVIGRHREVIELMVSGTLPLTLAAHTSSGAIIAPSANTLRKRGFLLPVDTHVKNSDA
jgi:hypothetical protein